MVGIITNQVRGRQDLCGERLLLIILGVGDIFQQSAPIWEIKIIIKMEYIFRQRLPPAPDTRHHMASRHLKGQASKFREAGIQAEHAL